MGSREGVWCLSCNEREITQFTNQQSTKVTRTNIFCWGRMLVVLANIFVDVCLWELIWLGDSCVGAHDFTWRNRLVREAWPLVFVASPVARSRALNPTKSPVTQAKSTSLRRITCKWDFTWRFYKNLRLPGIWVFENTSRLPVISTQRYKYRLLAFVIQYWDRYLARSWHAIADIGLDNLSCLKVKNYWSCAINVLQSRIKKPTNLS